MKESERQRKLGKISKKGHKKVPCTRGSAQWNRVESDDKDGTRNEKNIKNWR